ncbi:fatty acid desaturase [Pseudovibrio axinellae]|nr:fatty acid desaturase [Pseudovibrio axinellae]
MTDYFFVLLIALGLVAFVLDPLYHLNECRKIAGLKGVTDIHAARRAFSHYRPKKLDSILGPIQFVGHWLVIIGMIGLAFHIQLFVFDLLTIWVICSQLRALEELGHMAIHGILGGSKKSQILLADSLFQFPALMSSAEERRHRHCVLHHPNANLLDVDPGLRDFIEIGFVPGISKFKFWLGVFHPCTPKGIYERCRGILSHFKRDLTSPYRLTLRIVGIVATIAPFLLLGWGYGFLMFYLIPLLIVFPQFYWFSQVVEHRWFENVDGMDPLERELTSCRPTLYEGISGAIIRNSIFPIGDNHHLAHSLFPYLRWSYLGAADQLLIDNMPEYGKNTSRGLFFNSKKSLSAISYLRTTMIKSHGKTPDENLCPKGN